jgi:hypothetical protein
MMSQAWRRASLAVHVATSVGWLGVAAAYLALNVPALASDDETTVRAAYLMMEQVAYYAVTPLAVLSLVTGVLQALGTPWGLLRHYWVVISLLITAFANLVLLLHLPAVAGVGHAAREPATDVFRLGGDVFHAAAGLALLLVPLVLNIYKPRGLTRRGWRAQQRHRETTSPAAAAQAPTNP